MTRIRACGDRVFAVRMEETEYRGLKLPLYKYEKYCVGSVFSTNHRDLPPGTVIYYKRFDIQEVELEGSRFDVIRHGSIVGIQEGSK